VLFFCFYSELNSSQWPGGFPESGKRADRVFCEGSMSDETRGDYRNGAHHGSGAHG
jgi:hypothetical protein